MNKRAAGAPRATRQAAPCPPFPPGEGEKTHPHSSVVCSIATTAATMTEAEALENKPLQQRHTSGSGSSAPPEPPREDTVDHTYKEKEGPKPPRVIVWRNVVLMTVLHLAAAYGALLIPSASPLTLLWSVLCFVVSALGVTAGAHRLWSHRSYKASTPLKIFLSLANSMAFQNDIYEWARDHRVHHKYSETDADPHNAVRGFFFSHIGWLMLRKHPDVIEKGRKLELTDLQADKVVMFQRNYYKLSVVLMCFFIPMFVPWYLWGESLWVAYFVPALLRYTLVLNSTWLVNSAAHMWGNRPYDHGINPRENKFVTFSAIGEGYHNYHHTFPYDYATSEFGCKLNLTTCFIDFMCFLGLAKDRKRVSSELILARAQRTGDGSHRSG
ncbi:acyl-CoA desaturase isoform X1 [Pleuronectes platessa]|uniref:acyl-CoA desaturase isoform X1 n=1 Tax=Pleuronectes platessa TaxID=8262 RepID=UPI00232A2CD9|nr:acyl-CoA desaturase isoform X1 [Pleuronectes platessa]